MSGATPAKTSSAAGKPRSRTAAADRFNEKDLALLADLALLSEKAPEVYKEFMKEKRYELQHLRRLAWADLIAQVVGHMSGLVALAILTVIAWHAIDRNAASQGAAIICTGAVSIVAVFVTGRVTGRRRTQAGSNQEPNGLD